VKKQLITERDVTDAVRQGVTVISIQPDSIITAAAQDEALKHNIKFSLHQQKNHVTPSPQNSSETAQKSTENTLTIALGSDHGGYQLKEALKMFLMDQGHRIFDVGTDSEQPCDYPDFAYAVASLVASNKAERGIMIDSVGVASAIVANKVPGIRAIPCNEEFVARSSREHNNANVLTLGGKVIGIEMAKSIVQLWIKTPFTGGRHLTRVNKIGDVEKRFLK
jgi:ribose 5-phosphate isomerase B